jgi:hypothetical protein
MMLSPTVNFSISDDELKNEQIGKNILEYVRVFFFTNSIFLKVIFFKKKSELNNIDSEKTPTNSTHNILVENHKISSIENSLSNIDCDKATCNLSIRNYSIDDDNIDKVSDLDSLCKPTDSDTLSNSKSNLTPAVSEKKRSKINFRKILPFVKVKKVKVK